MSFESIEEWIDYGIKKGWTYSPVCDTHDGLPYTEEEQKEWEEGGDPCAVVLRLKWEPSII